jgi:hypothetical protein
MDSTMAKKGSKRIRRSSEQIISDLEKKIELLRQKAKVKEVKTSPALKAAMQIVRSIDKAMEVAKQEGENALAHALADGREPLASFFEKSGLGVPKARRPRGRRAKVE